VARQPDPDSPAAVAQPEPGDCIADIDPAILEDVAAYHWHAEPEGEPIPDDAERV
jgi:C-terminal processing protease CtpA/Prc